MLKSCFCFCNINYSRSRQDYIAVKEKYAKYLPHSAGRYAAKRFRKAQCPIVERLTNSMMMHGRNNGKKLMTVRIVKHAFEIIHLLTGEVGPKSLLIQDWIGGFVPLLKGSWTLKNSVSTTASHWCTTCSTSFVVGGLYLGFTGVVMW